MYFTFILKCLIDLQNTIELLDVNTLERLGLIVVRVLVHLFLIKCLINLQNTIELLDVNTSERFGVTYGTCKIYSWVLINLLDSVKIFKDTRQKVTRGGSIKNFNDQNHVVCRHYSYTEYILLSSLKKNLKNIISIQKPIQTR